VLKELLGSFSGYDIRILAPTFEPGHRRRQPRVLSELDMGRGFALSVTGKHFVPRAAAGKIQDEIRSHGHVSQMNLLETFSFPRRSTSSCAATLPSIFPSRTGPHVR